MSGAKRKGDSIYAGLKQLGAATGHVGGAAGRGHDRAADAALRTDHSDADGHARSPQAIADEKSRSGSKS